MRLRLRVVSNCEIEKVVRHRQRWLLHSPGSPFFSSSSKPLLFRSSSSCYCSTMPAKGRLLETPASLNVVTFFKLFDRRTSMAFSFLSCTSFLSYWYAYNFWDAICRMGCANESYRAQLLPFELLNSCSFLYFS